jgi:membrane-associated phospholipid phosphatase
MSLAERLVWLVALIGIQLLYFPINRTVQGGTIISTPWDDLVPFWPVWVIPYLLSILWWFACFVWATWKMEAARYRAFVSAGLVVMLSSYLLYILFPTYVQRPIVEGEGWLIDLISWLYENDRLHNAFPSGHTYTTALIVFFWWGWRPRLRGLWVAVGVIVVLSTLFTGQHHIADPIGGLLWAYLGYRFGMWWAVERRRAT